MIPDWFWLVVAAVIVLLAVAMLPGIARWAEGFNERAKQREEKRKQDAAIARAEEEAKRKAWEDAAPQRKAEALAQREAREARRKEREKAEALRWASLTKEEKEEELRKKQEMEDNVLKVASAGFGVLVDALAGKTDKKFGTTFEGALERQDEHAHQVKVREGDREVERTNKEREILKAKQSLAKLQKAFEGAQDGSLEAQFNSIAEKLTGETLRKQELRVKMKAVIEKLAGGDKDEEERLWDRFGVLLKRSENQ